MALIEQANDQRPQGKNQRGVLRQGLTRQFLACLPVVLPHLTPGEHSDPFGVIRLLSQVLAGLFFCLVETPPFDQPPATAQSFAHLGIDY